MWSTISLQNERNFPDKQITAAQKLRKLGNSRKFRSFTSLGIFDFAFALRSLWTSRSFLEIRRPQLCPPFLSFWPVFYLSPSCSDYELVVRVRGLLLRSALINDFVAARDVSGSSISSFTDNFTIVATLPDARAAEKVGNSLLSCSRRLQRSLALHARSIFGW